MSVGKLYLEFANLETDDYAYGCMWSLIGVYTSMAAAEEGVKRYTVRYAGNDGSRSIHDYDVFWHIDEVNSNEFDMELYNGVGSYYE